MRLKICEVYDDSRVYVGFYPDGSVETGERYVLNARDSFAFAERLLREFVYLNSYANQHILETECSCRVHAFLDAVYQCETGFTQVEPGSPITRCIALCVLDGCVQDSLDRKVQLGSSSPETPRSNGVRR